MDRNAADDRWNTARRELARRSGGEMEEFAHVTDPQPKPTLLARARVLFNSEPSAPTKPSRLGPPEQWGQVAVRVLAAGVAFVLVAGSGAAVGARVIAPRRAAAAVSSTGIDNFPRSEAGIFAARFALVYLTYDSGKAGDWQGSIAPYMALGADATNLKWDGKGKQSAFFAEPAGVTVKDQHHAVVKVAALTDGGRWYYLAVPLVVDDAGGMGVTTAPALVAPPSAATVGNYADTLSGMRDTVLEEALKPSLKGFFQAYAASDGAQLSYYAAPGSQFAGLNKTVDLGSSGIQDLRVESGPAARRNAVATVQWTDKATSASFVQSYRLVLVQTGGKWLVQTVAPQDQ